ncbi:MAG: hypothetical protein MUO21_02140 [Nitrososphaeraceae archaeon]|nr:hypothetical protein [Nitrososphaeraceae archaeon]
MDNNTIYIIIIIFVIIFLVKLFTIRKLEHLTQSSDEAIQNLASLYNKDQLTIGTIKATQLFDESMGSNTTVKAYIDSKITTQINNLNAASANLQNQINSLNGALGQYVRKGPIDLRVSYNAGYGNPGRDNWPISISDNYFLRSWHTPGQDAAANALGGRFSIL